MSAEVQYAVDKTVDCQGLSCPMPIVKTKRAIDEIHPGKVLEVIATDPGSVVDIQSFADRTGHEYLGTVQNGKTYKHYIRRATAKQSHEEKRHPHTVSHDALFAKVSDLPLIVDVREHAEYASGHIPGATSIPLGQIKDAIPQLRKLSEREIFVVCHSGNRSDTACQILHEHGFQRVFNVLGGMQKWQGPVVAHGNGASSQAQ